MFYAFNITIPKNTPKEKPETKVWEVTPGTIKRVAVYSSFGCRGYVFLVIKHGETQIYPTNTEEAFRLNGYPIESEVEYELTEKPYVIKLEGWSPGTHYPHSVMATMRIKPVEVVASSPSISEV